MDAGLTLLPSGAYLAHTTSVETLVADTVVGVAIAVVLFALYYALVLRRAGSQR
ncbi:hypothetical protein [Halomicrobium salinisoli]|uniref:hypothetical protein n=1 Tax=Halomicrobium salinisoli TaxID=2878391 RepID=UPI001CF0B526|nr:hypothetical protein [Halomicrobium salinisoli]